MSDTSIITGPIQAAKAYLLVRDDSAWLDSHSLTPGQVATIGRAPTNRIVLLDEICSRHHCEIFSSGGKWYVRDLGSRNGTQVDDVTIQGDTVLEDGQLIRLGETELAFTYELDDSANLNLGTSADSETGLRHVDEIDAGMPILERTKAPNSLLTAGSDPQMDASSASADLAKLYRLALSMGQTESATEICHLVLNTLHARTGMDIGAVLRASNDESSDVTPEDLKPVAYRTTGEDYTMVSTRLSRVVLNTREAMLAKDIEADSALKTSDSLGSLPIRSVICAPLRVGSRVTGLVHLYSIHSNNELNRHDLEFTLAVADQLAVALDNLAEKENLQEGLETVRHTVVNLREQLGLNAKLVGDSQSMQTLRTQIGTVAPTDATVLIRGESGVGKELVARAIHFNSNRQDSPFVCMNCAALSESLLESELFGHEKGAFTGATDRKTGKFEQAHNGTLFLDEVGEMGPSLQAKFLRVLEGHPFERVGGHVPIEVNVRVVAATNRALEEAVKDGTFRKDLYFRLQVVEILVPALRDHRSDIPVLTEYFLDRLRNSLGRQIGGFTDEAIEKLMNYDWPGNIRELQNTVERTTILSAGPWIGQSDIRLSTLSEGEEPERPAPAEAGWKERSLSEIEQEHILTTLEMTGWNKSKASQILGIERSTLDRKLKRYRVSRPPR